MRRLGDSGRRGLSIGFDEDALPRTILRGGNDIGFLTGLHERHTARATRVITDYACLHDIGDPVLQLHEDIGAVIDAQAVARTKVLIDPYPHPSMLPIRHKRFDSTTRGVRYSLVSSPILTEAYERDFNS
jgi:hypothetical protein